MVECPKKYHGCYFVFTPTAITSRQFFSNNPPEKWDFDNYINGLGSSSHSRSQKDTLTLAMNYHNDLDWILNKMHNLPREVRTYVSKLKSQTKKQANKPNEKSGNTTVKINVHGVLQANNKVAYADRVQISSSPSQQDLHNDYCNENGSDSPPSTYIPEEEPIEDDTQHIPSDLTEDRHPRVIDGKYDFPSRSESPQPAAISSDCEDEGDPLVSGILQELRKFRSVSKQLHPKSLSDTRMLALNHVYLFSDDRTISISSCLPEEQSRSIMVALKSENVVHLSDNALLWCAKLAMAKNQTWYSVQDITIPMLVEAQKNKDTHPTDLILANILHRASLAMVDHSPDIDLEDSFVHNFIANLFENIFQPEPTLEAAWANGRQGGKRLRGESMFKPDYVVFITQRTHRIDLACAEAKAPNNIATFPRSDLVKLGQEMRWMINRLVAEGVHWPVVGGILISGFDMTIFEMKMTNPSTYLMVELSRMSLFKNMSELSMVPIIVANLIQLKDITLTTAEKAKDCLRERSKGVQPTFKPPLSWLQASYYGLDICSTKKRKANNIDDSSQ